MRFVILYRNSLSLKEDEAERSAAKAAGFTVIDSRTLVQPGDLVIARYSALPYYSELELDIKNSGGRLLNTSAQHEYIADLENWVSDLKEMTPQTWKRLEDIPDIGPFILKGGTNSKKSRWSSLMFAKTKKEAIDIYFKLSDDGLIGNQKIYIREFVPLHTYMIGLGGIPITKEFRFFICDEEILCGAYYWSSHVDQLETIPSIDEVPKEFLKEAMRRIKNGAYAPRGYVLDVAITADGKPIVVELNDLQMSGTSENDLNLLYRNLWQRLQETENAHEENC